MVGLFIAMISIVGKVGLLAVQYIVLVLHIIWLVVAADPGVVVLFIDIISNARCWSPLS